MLASKHVRDFLIVDDTDILSRADFQLSSSIDQSLLTGVPLLTHLFSVISTKITKIMYCQNLDSLDYILVADSVGMASTSLTQLALRANTFGVLTPNDSHYAMGGHSRSSILVPIESLYVTSY